MKFSVGSKNAAKVNAVSEILLDYAHLADAEVIGIEVSSDIPAQPKSLEEIVRGARNRATNAYQDCTYSVGLESGLMEVPYTKSGYLDVCVADIFDGTEHHVGISSGWEFSDPEIFEEIITGENEMADVLVARGIFPDLNMRAGNGAIGYVTKGRLDRKGFTQQALRNALVHIDV